MQKLKTFRIAGLLLLNSVLSGLIALIVVHYSTPKIVSFDLKGTVALFTSELAASGISDAGVRDAKIKAFSQALSAATQDYAKKNHEVVLVSPAVVAGAADVTPAIQNLTVAMEAGKK